MTNLGPSALPPAVAAVVLLLLASGCASRGERPPLPRPHRAPPSEPAPRHLPEARPGDESSVLRTARSLIGARYRYGGESRREGFDCSGLALFVFERHGIPLPRTTRQQARAGSWVPLDALAIGDLVFFSDPDKPAHHVGIVSSDPGEPLTMVHASSSRGVVETDILDSGYWLERLRFGRRVLPR